jgi:hypothetical protein
MLHRIKREQLKSVYCGYLQPVVRPPALLPEILSPCSGYFELGKPMTLEFHAPVSSGIENIVVVSNGKWIDLLHQEICPSNEKLHAAVLCFSGVIEYLEVPSIAVYYKKLGLYHLFAKYEHPHRLGDICNTVAQDSMLSPHEALKAQHVAATRPALPTVHYEGHSSSPTKLDEDGQIVTPLHGKKELDFPTDTLPAVVYNGCITLHPRALVCGFQMCNQFVSSTQLFAAFFALQHLTVKAVLVKGWHTQFRQDDVQSFDTTSLARSHGSRERKSVVRRTPKRRPKQKRQKVKPAELEFISVKLRQVSLNELERRVSRQPAHPDALQKTVNDTELRLYDVMSGYGGLTADQFTCWELAHTFNGKLVGSASPSLVEKYTLVLYLSSGTAAPLYEVAALYHFKCKHQPLFQVIAPPQATSM